MAARKKTCLAGHEPHADCNMHCCAITPERAAEIRSQALSGTNWAAEADHGPACACGAFLEGSTVTSWGSTVEKGECHRHGTTQGSRIARKR